MGRKLRDIVLLLSISSVDGQWCHVMDRMLITFDVLYRTMIKQLILPGMHVLNVTCFSPL